MKAPWANVALLALLLTLVISGYLGLVSGEERSAWRLWLHGIAAYALIVLFVWKGAIILDAYRRKKSGHGSASSLPSYWFCSCSLWPWVSYGRSMAPNISAVSVWSACIFIWQYRSCCLSFTIPGGSASSSGLRAHWIAGFFRGSDNGRPRRYLLEIFNLAPGSAQLGRGTASIYRFL
jgi:hypothetical protein